MTAFYNEHDPYAAQYLRNLMTAGLIAPGIVDERDIQEIEPWELVGYTQVHMFAGIGIWSGALRAAGWPDDEPIWTGSCPCQPFSNAGQKKGFSDDRHLWPFWRSFIAQCRPSRIAGEQVASKDGRIWLDIVSTDVEALGFAFGASDLCAAGFGGAHIRQREYFVGLAEPYSGECDGLTNPKECEPDRETRRRQQSHRGASDDRNVGGMGNASNGDGRRGKCDPQTGIGQNDERRRGFASANSRNTMPSRGLEYSNMPDQGNGRTPGGEQPLHDVRNIRDANPSIRSTRKAGSFWHDVDWLLCRNSAGEPSWRPVGPGTFPLAHGVADRMGKLRAYGNALDFETAKGFCEVLVEICLGL